MIQGLELEFSECFVKVKFRCLVTRHGSLTRPHQPDSLALRSEYLPTLTIPADDVSRNFAPNKIHQRGTLNQSLGQHGPELVTTGGQPAHFQTCQPSSTLKLLGQCHRDLFRELKTVALR